MTNELEKQFFQCFGVEPMWECIKPSDGQCNECGCCELKYPQITSDILLGLICLFAKEMNCTTNYWYTVEELKENLLREFILEKDSFVPRQVQALFKEG